jgi:hypothetical protein
MARTSRGVLRQKLADRARGDQQPAADSDRSELSSVDQPANGGVVNVEQVGSRVDTVVLLDIRLRVLACVN